jgi:spermidine/putrescine transport system ATP-binding protein
MDLDLECRDVVKTFGSFTAVDRVSFGIEAGSFFSILGPSGCGKTTLLRMIAGFGEPGAGDILIKGRSVLALPPNRRPVNMVFQHLALFPMMSVAGNIGYGLRRRGVGRSEIGRRVANVLERINLPEAGPRRIHELSGGQKQRVAIARCIVLDPAVLLLDEPLGALDLKLREHMKVELKQLQHQFGTTFVYITHDQSEALVMSDRVAVMNAGRFEQVGTPQELFYDPRTAFVAGFVGDSNRWRGRVLSADGQGVKIEIEGGTRIIGVPRGAERLLPGAEAEIFVRPEAITMRRAGGPPAGDADGTNRWSGTLESLLFNGASSRALVRIGGGDLIAVALPRAEDTQAFSEGAQIDLAVSLRQCLCFAAPARAGRGSVGVMP